MADARLLGSFPGVTAWADTLLARPSVARAAPDQVGPRTRKAFAERAAKARAA